MDDEYFEECLVKIKGQLLAARVLMYVCTCCMIYLMVGVPLTLALIVREPGVMILSVLFLPCWLPLIVLSLLAKPMQKKTVELVKEVAATTTILAYKEHFVYKQRPIKKTWRWLLNPPLFMEIQTRNINPGPVKIEYSNIRDIAPYKVKWHWYEHYSLLRTFNLGTEMDVSRMPNLYSMYGHGPNLYAIWLKEKIPHWNGRMKVDLFIVDIDDIEGFKEIVGLT